jgi:hypothetical protein
MRVKVISDLKKASELNEFPVEFVESPYELLTWLRVRGGLYV